MTLASIIAAGILTYFTRMTMIALISRDMLGDKIKAVLEYVPSAVFPAIIFPGIFINDFGTFIEMNDPKIFGALVAVIVGYFSKNIIATILAGLFSYWFLIFVVVFLKVAFLKAGFRKAIFLERPVCQKRCF